MSEPRLTEEMEREVAEVLRKVDDARIADGGRWYYSTAGTKYTINGDIDGPSFRHDPELAECWDEDIANLIVTARNALPAYVAELARTRSALRAAVEALENCVGTVRAEGMLVPNDGPFHDAEAALTAARAALEPSDE